MNVTSSDYSVGQYDAIDAGVSSALPKELIQLIASYIPPDFALRWKFLEPAFARLPTVTACRDRNSPAHAAQYILSFEFDPYTATVLPPHQRLMYATADLETVMRELTAHAIERRPVRGDHRNRRPSGDDDDDDAGAEFPKVAEPRIVIINSIARN